MHCYSIKSDIMILFSILTELKALSIFLFKENTKRRNSTSSGDPAVENRKKKVRVTARILY